MRPGAGRCAPYRRGLNVTRFDVWGDGSHIQAVLARLSKPGAVLAAHKSGFAMFARGDRRRRACARLSASGLRLLLAEGTLEPAEGPDAFRLSPAGAKRLARALAPDALASRAQHGPIGPRAAMDETGAVAELTGAPAAIALSRLNNVRLASGAMFFAPSELRMAALLRAAFERGEVGLIRGSDFSAAPQSGVARGPAAERAQIGAVDARALVQRVLSGLGAGARAVVEAVVLREEGLEAVERRLNWPPRSAKIALKLALQQIAVSGVFRS